MDRFSVEKIPMNDARDFIMERHYTGGCGTAAMTWGLFEDDELVGAIAFQTPISENVRKSILESDGDRECWCSHIEEDHKYRQHVTELHRMVTLDRLPPNTETWFISRALDCLKEYKPKYWVVISFADATEGHRGTMYQAANARYYGTTGESTFYRDEDGRLRPPRSCGENITIDDARERGWEIEKREAKHRYLWFLPDGSRHRQWLENHLQVEEEPYPSETVAV